MGDPPSPDAPLPPPTRSNLPVLYYGIVIIGIAAIILGLYNLVIVQWCTDITNRRSQQRGGGPTSSWRFRNSNINHVSSFKYRREDEEGGDTECAVCLSVFEQGEELRQLPKCKHLFHAPCIDMWLYSHMDCPLCRSPVGPPDPILHQSEHSRQELLGPVTLV